MRNFAGGLTICRSHSSAVAELFSLTVIYRKHFIQSKSRAISSWALLKTHVVTSREIG